MLAMLVGFMFLGGKAVDMVAAVVLVIFAVPVLVSTLRKKADRDRDQLPPIEVIRGQRARRGTRARPDRHLPSQLATAHLPGIRARNIWRRSTFEGNKSIRARPVDWSRAAARPEPGRAPDPYLVVVDGQRIPGEYLRRGFLEVDVRSRVERHGDATTVIYTIAEGPRADTTSMITGLPANDPELTEAKVRDALPLKDGEPFSYEPYDEAKEQMLGIIEDAGYAHAKLNAHVVVDRVNHEAIIHLDYDLGPEVQFGTVDDHRASTCRARDAVRARVAFEPASSTRRPRSPRRSASSTTCTGSRRCASCPTRATATPSTFASRCRTQRAHELALGGGVGMDPTTYEVRGRTGYSIVGWPFPLDRLRRRPAARRTRCCATAAATSRASARSRS